MTRFCASSFPKRTMEQEFLILSLTRPKKKLNPSCSANRRTREGGRERSTTVFWAAGSTFFPSLEQTPSCLWKMSSYWRDFSSPLPPLHRENLDFFWWGRKSESELFLPSPAERLLADGGGGAHLSSPGWNTRHLPNCSSTTISTTRYRILFASSSR